LGAELLGMRRSLLKVAFFRTPAKPWSRESARQVRGLRDVGKEVVDLLERRGIRLAPVGEMVPLFWGSGAELEVRWDTFGLPAVDSAIFMELPALTLFSFILLGAHVVPTGVDVVADRFTGFDVATSFRLTRGDLGAGERCLLTASTLERS
jgi:hypothetical protein